MLLSNYLSISSNRTVGATGGGGWVGGWVVMVEGVFISPN